MDPVTPIAETLTALNVDALSVELAAGDLKQLDEASDTGSRYPAYLYADMNWRYPAES